MPEELAPLARRFRAPVYAVNPATGAFVVSFVTELTKDPAERFKTFTGPPGVTVEQVGRGAIETCGVSCPFRDYVRSEADADPMHGRVVLIPSGRWMATLAVWNPTEFRKADLAELEAAVHATRGVAPPSPPSSAAGWLWALALVAGLAVVSRVAFGSWSAVAKLGFSSPRKRRARRSRSHGRRRSESSDRR
jgi:hypothetical protein